MIFTTKRDWYLAIRALHTAVDVLLMDGSEEHEEQAIILNGILGECIDLYDETP